MDLQQLKRAERLAEWANIVSACRNSGMPIKEWCRENGINEKAYFYRQKRVWDAEMQ